MKQKICCMFNYNPSYRLPIYYEMAKHLDCEFYFGDNVFEQLKQFDAKMLPGFKSYLKAKKIGNSFVWFSGIRQVLKNKYSIYILTGSPGLLANWIILFYSKVYKKKVYCWCHGPKSYRNDLMTKIVTAPFFRAMTGIFLYNKYNENFLLPLGVDENKIYIIHNSLNTDVQTTLYKSLEQTSIYKNHFGNSNPVIIFIGRIQKRMKVQLLVEAVERMRNEGVQTNMVLVGPYMDGEDIEALVRNKGLENNTWFYGASYEEDITAELLYNADVCVAPGTVGLTAIHSLSYGTPVITNNNFSAIGPEFEAIKPGETGDFFIENDVDSLVDCIKKWINLPDYDRQLVRVTARAEIEKNWSIEYQINLLQKVLL